MTNVMEARESPVMPPPQSSILSGAMTSYVWDVVSSLKRRVGIIVIVNQAWIQTRTIVKFLGMDTSLYTT